MIEVSRELYIAHLVKTHFNRSSISKIYSKLFIDCVLTQMFYEDKEDTIVTASYIKHRFMGILTYKEKFYIQGTCQ